MMSNGMMLVEGTINIDCVEVKRRLRLLWIDCLSCLAYMDSIGRTNSATWAT